MAWTDGVQLLALVTLAALLVLLAATVRALRRPSPDQAMHVLAHVEELRRRVLRVAAVLLAVTLLSLLVRIEQRGAYPLPVLAVYDSLAAQFFRAASGHLVPEGVQLVVTTPVDGFMAQFTIALGLGIAAALPVAFHQICRFLAPALRPQERTTLARLVVPSLLLFLAGAAVAYLWVLPVTLAALYQFSDALGAQSLLRVADLATFTMTFLLGFGIAFQTPVAMAGLSRAGVVHPRTWWRHFRVAVVVMLVAGMVLTPDPTIISQLMLAGPLIVLYALGAVVAQRVAPREA